MDKEGFIEKLGVSFRMGRSEYTYLWKKEDIDHDKLKYRTGDLIRCKSAIAEFHDYRDWYYKDEEKIKFGIQKIKQLPIYGHKKLAIINKRYRVTKKKGHTYRDYGTEVIFLEGDKKGCKKRFFTCSPFNVISKYPHEDLFNINLSKANPVLKKIFQIDIWKEDLDTRKDFIKQVQNLL